MCFWLANIRILFLKWQMFRKSMNFSDSDSTFAGVGRKNE